MPGCVEKRAASFLKMIAVLLTAGVPISVSFSSVSLTTRIKESTCTRLWSFSRRDALLSSFPPVVASAGMWAFSNPVDAAGPVTLGETEGIGAIVDRAFRPKPPKLLRQKLNRDFAVLLMRSSYNALDAIDCVPMDQFQRDFFFIRQSEYQPYIKQLGPGAVQQGELTDPNYFDFISYAQYSAIAREISKDPPIVFEELQPVEVGEDEPQKFVSKLVKRDPSLSNDRLAARHSEIVGAAILNRFEEVFGSTDAAIPKILPGSRPDTKTLISSLSQMVRLFIINGFAFDGNTSVVTSGPEISSAAGSELCITLNAPANLWSGKSLQQKRLDPVNDFVLKASRELLRRAGYTISKSNVKYEGNQEKTFMTIR